MRPWPHPQSGFAHAATCRHVVLLLARMFLNLVCCANTPAPLLSWPRPPPPTPLLTSLSAGRLFPFATLPLRGYPPILPFYAYPPTLPL